MKTETLKFERSTKGTHLFTNKDSDFITSLYVKKASMASPPSSIVVTVSVPDEAIENSTWSGEQIMKAIQSKNWIEDIDDLVCELEAITILIGDEDFELALEELEGQSGTISTMIAKFKPLVEKLGED